MEDRTLRTPPSAGPTQVPFAELAARIGELVSQFETQPDVMIRDRMEELLLCIDALHRAPLKRLMALLETYSWDSGGGLSIPPYERALSDPLIRRLLELYDLAPVEIDATTQRAQAEAALAQIRPYVQSHGGEVAVANVSEGVITVELSGHCRGCTASQATLRGLVEGALREHVDGFRRLEVTAPVEPVAPHPPPAAPVISLDQLVATLPGRGAR